MKKYSKTGRVYMVDLLKEDHGINAVRLVLEYPSWGEVLNEDKNGTGNGYQTFLFQLTNPYNMKCLDGLLNQLEVSDRTFEKKKLRLYFHGNTIIGASKLTSNMVYPIADEDHSEPYEWEEEN